VPKMLYPDQGLSTDGIVEPTNRLETDMYGCLESDDAVRVAYVSKMFAVKKGELPENQRKPLNAEDMRNRARAGKEERDRRLKAESEGVEYIAPPAEIVDEEAKKKQAELEEADKDREVLIGFARLYSGSISINDTLYAVLPKYSTTAPPSSPWNSKHLAPIRVAQLYMMMGRELVAVDRVTAGNLFAISGLEGVVGRNATLCGMGHGKEVKVGNGRDEDQECLINLAGVSSTVSFNAFPLIQQNIDVGFTI
jgi:ribosome assembly protein 1